MAAGADGERRPLAGRRILVVEDEYLVAREVAGLVQALGAEVVGPVGRLGPAQALGRSERIDGAILDVRLRDERVDVLADELVARGVPIIFATGYDSGVLPPRLRDLPRVEKPFSHDALERLAARLFGGDHASPS